MPAPWHSMMCGSPAAAGAVTLKLAAVSCSATAMAVRVCSVSGPQAMREVPPASAMKMISWSWSLHPCQHHGHQPLARGRAAFHQPQFTLY